MIWIYIPDSLAPSPSDNPGVSISEQLDVLREQLVEERMQRQAA
jgi:hypothetical protein